MIAGSPGVLEREDAGASACPPVSRRPPPARAGSEAARRERPAKWPARRPTGPPLKTYGKFSPQIRLSNVFVRIQDGPKRSAHAAAWARRTADRPRPRQSETAGGGEGIGRRQTGAACATRRAAAPGPRGSHGRRATCGAQCVRAGLTIVGHWSMCAELSLVVCWHRRRDHEAPWSDLRGEPGDSATGC